MTTLTQEQESQAIAATNSIAMVVVLTSFAMLFATLFLGYALYRLTSNVWPPAGMQELPLIVPTLSTALIVLSSLTLWSFQVSYRKQVIHSLNLAVTILLGLGFIACQFVLWSTLKQSGLLAGTNIFTSIIYAFTWIHVAHMVAAILGLFLLIPVVIKKNVARPNLIENVSKFWHFLGIVWLVIYLTIFVL